MTFEPSLLFSVALEHLFKVSVELQLLLHEDGVVHGAQIAAKLGSDVTLVKVLGVELAVALVCLLVHDGAVVDRVAEERLPHAVEILENPRPADDVMFVKENWNSPLKSENISAFVNSYTEYGVRSFPRFCQKFSWLFHMPVGNITAAVQPGKKKLARGTSTKTCYQTLRQSY